MVNHPKLSALSGIVVASILFPVGWIARGSEVHSDARLTALRTMSSELKAISDKLPEQKIVTVTETKNVYKDAAIRNRGLYIEQNGIVYDPPSDAEILFKTGCVSWKGGTVSTWEKPLNKTFPTGRIEICGTYKLVFTEQAYCGDIQYCTSRR